MTRESASGQRADLTIVDAGDPERPSALATLAARRVVFQTPDAFARFH